MITGYHISLHFLKTKHGNIDHRDILKDVENTIVFMNTLMCIETYVCAGDKLKGMQSKTCKESTACRVLL